MEIVVHETIHVLEYRFGPRYLMEMIMKANPKSSIIGAISFWGMKWRGMSGIRACSNGSEKVAPVTRKRL
uniref:Uncharacterized protein n=1 Tax=Acrobeloides nanus TaxID=290746 RepID=A0A914DB72_9BILA